MERKHRHLLNVARSLKIQAHVPNMFFLGGDCILTACYLVNVTPSLLFQGKSPLEIMLERKLNIDHLRIFVCLCFAKNLALHAKFASRGIRFVFIGYSEFQNGYWLYNLDTYDILYQ